VIQEGYGWTLFYANNIKKYQWNSNNETGYGNIAQELQKVYPDKVSNMTQDNETYLAVTSPDNTDLLITIAQQQRQIDNLTSENQNLKSRFSELCKENKDYSWCQES